MLEVLDITSIGVILALPERKLNSTLWVAVGDPQPRFLAATIEGAVAREASLLTGDKPELMIAQQNWDIPHRKICKMLSLYC